MIATATPIPTREEYTRMAKEYMDSLPLREFMEGEPQAWQRQITMDSFLLIRARRPEVLPLSDLLVQVPPSQREDRPRGPRQHGRPERRTPREGAELQHGPREGRILIVMEYVSADSEEKDYGLNIPKYRTA